MPAASRRVPLVYRAALAATVGLLTPAAAMANAVAQHGMVAAAHPLAAKAGVKVLKAGGNAVDAAVATAFALAVVEPYASGIGGGGFLVYYHAATGEVTAYDYREVAPSGLEDSHFRSGTRMRGTNLRYGGMSIAVPGMLRGLHAAQAKHGNKPFAELLETAVHHAEAGFEVSEELSGHISDKMDLLQENPAAAAIYLEDNIFPLQPGTLLKQTDLAATLRQIQQLGPDAIYGAEPAARIAAAVQAAGGVVTAEDIMGYQPRKATVIQASYRGYDIATIGAPSGGGLNILKALRLLQHFPLADYGPDSPITTALLLAAMEQSYQSIDELVGDPRFVPVDHAALLSDEWVAGALKRMRVPAGVNASEQAMLGVTGTVDPYDSVGNTTHFSVVDKDGNMVALTQTINFFFASGVLVPGMGLMLNNEMFDFTFRDGSPNLPQAGKVPRSSMAPMIVFRDGKPVATLGTPGGSRIPAALTQILVNAIDFGMPLGEAIDAPRVFLDVGRDRVDYENRFSAERIQAAIELLGTPAPFSTSEHSAHDRFFGGAQGVWITTLPDGTRQLTGAADPRRGGAAHGY